MRINFLHGLDDDIREQALKDFWKENRNFLFVAVIVLFASFGATQYYKHHKAETIQQQAIAFYQASQSQSAESFSKLAADTTGGYKAMALFEVAKNTIEKGDKAEALKAYAEIRTGDATVLLRDLATILEAELLLATDAATAEKHLMTLVAEKSPYRLTALEMLAINAQNKSEFAVAQNYYEELLAQGGLAETMRNRIEARLSYLKGKGLITAHTEGATN